MTAAHNQEIIDDGGRALAVVTDVADPASVERLLQEALSVNVRGMFVPMKHEIAATLDNDPPVRGAVVNMASLTSTGKMGAGTPHSPRQAIYAAMLFNAHPTAIRTSRLQRFAFASLSGLGRTLGMSL